MKKRILLFTLIAGITCLVFSSTAIGAGRNSHITPSAAITGTFSTCIGSTTTLNDATTGGIWTSSNTAVATIGTSNGIVLGITAGTATISYAATSGTVTQVVTINPLPNAGSISGASGVCVSAFTTLTDGTSGGTWSSSNTAVATVGATTGKVTGVAVGTSDITYTVTNSCGTAHATYVIPVFTTPTIASITGTNVFCQPNSVTLSDVTTNGVWSSSNTAVAPVDSVGIVNGLSGGTATISYTVVYSCGTARATYTVTVNPLPVVAPINGFSALCLGTSGFLSDASAGDVWSSGNTAVAIVNASSGFITTISAGITTIRYTGTNGCGSTTVSHTVTVDTLPPSITIYGPSFVCQSGTITLTDSDATAGCTWSSTNTLAATVASTGVVTGVAGGSTTISLIAHNSCGSDTATRELPVHPLPTTSPISGQSKICVAAYITLEDGISGGTWSTHSSSIATADPAHGVITGVAAGNTTVTYTLTNACGNSYVTYPVTVNPSPVPVISASGNIFTCTTIYPSYEWEWDGIIILGQTFRTYAATDTGHYTVTVTDANGCTGSSTVYFYNDNAVTNVTSLAQSVQIYPNPTQSVLFIKAAGMVDVQFSTIDGRVLSDVKDARQLDLSSFPAGVYYIVIYDSNSGAKLKAEKILKTGN